MKRIIYISSLLLVFMAGKAQDTKFGVFVAPEVSWMMPDDRDVTSNGVVPGFKGGLVIDKYFQDNYAIHSGIAIGTQGGIIQVPDSMEFTAFGEDTMLYNRPEVEYRVNYITIPLNLKLKTKEIGYFSYFARLGFTTQIRMKARASSSDDVLDKSSITDEIAFFNLAYNFGGGIEYSLGGDAALILGINYTNGFVDIAKSNDLTAYSRGLSLRLGVIF